MKISEVASKDLYHRALEIIAALPDDEVLTGSELADKLGVLKGSNHVRHAFAELTEFREKARINGGDAWVYGTKAALKNLRELRLAETK